LGEKSSLLQTPCSCTRHRQEHSTSTEHAPLRHGHAKSPVDHVDAESWVRRVPGGHARLLRLRAMPVVLLPPRKHPAGVVCSSAEAVGEIFATRGRVRAGRVEAVVSVAALDGTQNPRGSEIEGDGVESPDCEGEACRKGRGCTSIWGFAKTKEVSLMTKHDWSKPRARNRQHTHTHTRSHARDASSLFVGQLVSAANADKKATHTRGKHHQKTRNGG